MLRFTIFTLMLASAAPLGGQAAVPEAADTPAPPFLFDDPVTPLPEQYTVPTVDKAQFLKTQVEIGQTATFPTYTEELLRVNWRRNDPIDVAIVKPAGVARPPIVLFLYGYGTDPEKFLHRQFCATLAARGFAAVGFQTALTGPRYHDRPLKKWFVSELPESIGASVHDVQLMIDYLETRDDLDASHIGIFGQGSGGAIAILAASVDRRIKAIDVMNPWGDWPDWLAHSAVVPEEERAGYTSPTFLDNIVPLDPIHSMDRLADRPFRLQQTLFDPAVPEDVRKTMQEALPANAQLARYADQAAYMASVSRNGRMLDWMQDRLGISRTDGSELSSSLK